MATESAQGIRRGVPDHAPSGAPGLRARQRANRAGGGAGVINTAYIERLNATFRQRMAWLARRTRSLAQHSETLRVGMFIVGCVYNFCDDHHILRLKLSVGERGYR